VHVKELGHLVLYVRNLERSRRFYRDLLGWTEISIPGEEIGFPAAAFSSGRTHHELLLIEVGEDATPIPTGRRVGMYHFGLKIGDTDVTSRIRTAMRSSCTSMSSRPSGRMTLRPSSLGLARFGFERPSYPPARAEEELVARSRRKDRFKRYAPLSA